MAKLILPQNKDYIQLGNNPGKHKTLIAEKYALTRQQYDVLSSYVTGYPAKRAAQMFGHSSRTIETYCRDIRNIFQVDDRVELLMVLHKLGALTELLEHFYKLAKFAYTTS